MMAVVADACPTRPWVIGAKKKPIQIGWVKYDILLLCPACLGVSNDLL